MYLKLQLRRPRFADERGLKYKTPLLHLEDDDDDDDDETTTTPVIISDLTTTTHRLGMEFVTIPGQDARPFTTIGPVAGVILFVLVITLTAIVVWLRRGRQRQHFTRDTDKLPLSPTTAEGYCPYNIEMDAVPSGVYIQLDQPSVLRFPNARFSQAGPSARAVRADRARSLCDYDDPREPRAPSPTKAKAQRPQSCVIGLGDYDEPDFRIPLTENARGANHARHSMVMVNEGARELTLNPSVTQVAEETSPKPDEVYYSSLKEMESTSSVVREEQDDRIPEPDVVYYSSINLKGELNASIDTSLLPGTIPKDAGVNTRVGSAWQRPHYYTLEGEDSKSEGKQAPVKGLEVRDSAKDDEQDSLKYDYLQVGYIDKGPITAPSTSGDSYNNSIQSVGYLKLAESQCGGLPLASAAVPSCVPTVQGQESAGNKTPGTEFDGEESMYDTLQRSMPHVTSPRSNSNEIYNVLFLD